MSEPENITISVVTPSFRQPDFLRLCATSVADQQGPGLDVQHIVHDSLSGPAIAEALRPVPRVELVSEKDEGMYDAINRGWQRSKGDILCWLNCDEQYLPGALGAVADYFRGHPDVDVLFANAIIVDAQGHYICSREVLVPHLYHTWTSHLNTFSCSMFLRAGLVRQQHFTLDSSYKIIGDAELIIRLLRAGVKMDVLHRFTSTFIDHGENLGLRPGARDEHVRLLAQAPPLVGPLRPAWKVAHRLRRWTHGHYRPKPFSYDIYTPASPTRRLHIEVPRPTFYWGSRMNIDS